MILIQHHFEDFFDTTKVYELGNIAVEIFKNPSQKEISDIPTVPGNPKYSFFRFFVDKNFDVYAFDGNAMHDWIIDRIPGIVKTKGEIIYPDKQILVHFESGAEAVMKSHWVQQNCKGFTVKHSSGSRVFGVI